MARKSITFDQWVGSRRRKRKSSSHMNAYTAIEIWLPASYSLSGNEKIWQGRRRQEDLFSFHSSLPVPASKRGEKNINQGKRTNASAIIIKKKGRTINRKKEGVENEKTVMTWVRQQGVGMADFFMTMRPALDIFFSRLENCPLPSLFQLSFIPPSSFRPLPETLKEK